MLERGNDLTPFIINALSCLPLSADLKAQIREILLSRLPHFTPSYLPSLVHFILNQSDPQDMNAVVQALRENLVASFSQMEAQSLKKIFKHIENSFMQTKAFTEAWIKAFTHVTTSSDVT